LAREQAAQKAELSERAGKRITLYREEVAPLRLSTPFAQPDADTRAMRPYVFAKREFLADIY
jgi:hypothetical protein